MVVDRTPEEQAIRERDAADAGWVATEWKTSIGGAAVRDRHRLLALLDAERAEVDRLTAALMDEGYRDAIRLAEAVNEVVAHERGSIEEAWRYGDAQRDIVMKQQRELLTALAEMDRLTAERSALAEFAGVVEDERARIRAAVEGLPWVAGRDLVLAAIDGGEK